MDMDNKEIMMEQIHLLDYWNIVKKHLSLAVTVFSTVVAGTLFYIFTATPIYEATSRILLTEDLSRSVMNSELSQSILNDQLRYETELQILRGDPIYQDVLSSLKLTQAPEGSQEYHETLDKLKKNVECQRLRNTRLLEIKATSISPDTAALIANTIVSVYRMRYKANQIESSRNTASWLNEQLVDLEYKVKKSQQELLDYITKEKITFVSDGTGLENELKIDLFKAPDETLLEDIHSRLIQAKLSKDEVLQRYKGKHPKMLKAVAAVEALEREYLQEKDRLSQEREALKDKIIEAREKSVKYDILKRQVDTNKELYNLFVKKMQEVDLTEGVGEGDLRVVESASAPLLPAKPKKRLILLIGLIIGASLGIGSAFLIEYMDRSLKSKEEIEQLTGLPVMSSITFFDKEILVKDWDNYFTNSSFRKEHELFRVLRANIKFSDLKQKSKVVLVTSSQPGEGKTTISARLAINMAASGEKTLLIDGDLRKPNIHKIFELDNKVGLTNLMVEESSNGKYINYNKVKGLDIITCGQVPAQPAELIENSRIKNLIAEFSSQYDRIIIDSPPIATVIDAALLAEMCDGVLLVIDPRSTDRYILKQAQTQIEKVGVRIIGLVLNKITQAGDGYYSYSYYYKNYDYYGSDDQPKKKKRFHRRKKEHKQEITT